MNKAEIEQERMRGVITMVIDTPMKEHWNKIYSTRDVEKLSWYEEIPEPSIRLLSKCHINKDEFVLDVGAGASTFIDYLNGLILLSCRKIR